MTQPCPRQTNEAVLPVQKDHKSHWEIRDGVETCSYCGSLSPAEFFKAISEKRTLGPTDKNYKVYVDVPHPNAGQPSVISSANHDPQGDGWVEVTKENIDDLPLDAYQRENYLGHWVKIAPQSDTLHAKFYFQHLSDDERTKFIELLNAHELVIGMPGHFYQLPFFIKPGGDSA